MILTHYQLLCIYNHLEIALKAIDQKCSIKYIADA